MKHNPTSTTVRLIALAAVCLASVVHCGGEADVASEAAGGTTGSSTTSNTTSGGGFNNGTIEAGRPSAGELVSAGQTVASPKYRMVFTLGQPSLHQGTATSNESRIQGGLVGATAIEATPEQPR